MQAELHVSPKRIAAFIADCAWDTVWECLPAVIRTPWKYLKRFWCHFVVAGSKKQEEALRTVKDVPEDQLEWLAQEVVARCQEQASKPLSNSAQELAREVISWLRDARRGSLADLPAAEAVYHSIKSRGHRPIEPSRMTSEQQSIGRLVSASLGGRRQQRRPGEGVMPEIPGYQMMRPLGSGGCATVYLARHEKTDELRAVKVGEALDPEDLNRLDRELAVLQSAEHPNLVRYREHKKLPDGRWYIAMEYLGNVRLRDLLANRHVRPSLRHAIAVADQILRGLAALHEEQIIHRDLKPENVMVDDEFNVRLIDFGLAKPLHGAELLTQAWDLIGTLPYMSPEQLERKSLTPATDIWSFGVIFHELLIGELPFQSVGEIVKKPFSLDSSATDFTQQCPECGVVLPIRNPALIGKNVDCPKCHTHFTVERPGGEDDARWGKKAVKPTVASAGAEQVPPEFRSFLRKCLSYEISQRFPDAREARAAFLEAYAELRARLQFERNREKWIAILDKGLLEKFALEHDGKLPADAIARFGAFCKRHGADGSFDQERLKEILPAVFDRQAEVVATRPEFEKARKKLGQAALELSSAAGNKTAEELSALEAKVKQCGREIAQLEAETRDGPNKVHEEVRRLLAGEVATWEERKRRRQEEERRRLEKEETEKRRRQQEAWQEEEQRRLDFQFENTEAVQERALSHKRERRSDVPIKSFAVTGAVIVGLIGLSLGIAYWQDGLHVAKLAIEAFLDWLKPDLTNTKDVLVVLFKGLWGIFLLIAVGIPVAVLLFGLGLLFPVVCAGVGAGVGALLGVLVAYSVALVCSR